MTASTFDLLDRPLVFIPIAWPGLAVGDDGGAVSVDHTIDIQVEILDRDEFQDWIRDGSVTVADKVERAASELRVFRAVAKGWRKVKANGRNPEFSDENILRLLAFPGFVSAFGAAYMTAWGGKVETREGNSAGSPAPGPAGEPSDETTEAATPSS